MNEPSWGFDPEAASRPEDGYFGMNVPVDEGAVVVVPVPFEATTCYGQGTARGPEAMRRASHHLEFFQRGLGRPYRAGIATLPAERWRPFEELNTRGLELARGARASTGEDQRKGLCDALDGIGAQLNDGVRREVEHGLDAGQLVAVVGGDHSVAFGSIAAVAERERELGVLQVDAHADLRFAYEGFKWSHASIMNNVLAELPQVTKLVQVGIRDFSAGEYEAIRAQSPRVTTCFDEDLAALRLRGVALAPKLEALISELPEKVYVSFDIDGLDPTLCPATGTPVPGGLSFHEAWLLLDTLLKSGRRVVGFDLCEVSGTQEWDANVGARVLYRLIAIALRSRGVPL